MYVKKGRHGVPIVRQNEYGEHRARGKVRTEYLRIVTTERLGKVST